MDPQTEAKYNIPQARKPRRYRNLVLGLRALVISIAIAGIVVAAIPAPKSFIAIGILGPAFVTTFICSSIDFLFTIFKPLPTIRPDFAVIIDCFIAIGSIVCIICFGLFREWWAGSSGLGEYLGPLATQALFKVALGLACATTTLQIIFCLIWLVE
ncbi:hypothetical protein FBEOM_1942 [Fusarium beomiforme]|uniref:MARVEL domain-containing protein n=1 Tax=Fusarium beomiforme TaxID=44412 RepID=A0A9P5ASB9_9HYPO|nr:hypothetical protein FBEOM_1942 [Fusarium beomiforme]